MDLSDKSHDMKKLLYPFITILALSSCATVNETQVSRKELLKESRSAHKAVVENAVESGRFIVRFDRIYFTHGGMADLVPRANYMIIDEGKAVISAAYLGRQFGYRPISGINAVGRTVEYALTGDASKGKYDLDVKVDSRGDSFNVFLSIGPDGSCTVSMSSARISNVRYSGHLVPLNEKEQYVPFNRGETI